MPVYRYALYNAHARRQTFPKAEIIPKSSPVKLESSDGTDTELLSDHEPASTNDNFDLARFFDFQSYDYQEAQKSYEQYREASNHSPFRFQQPVYQQFPMYSFTAPPPPPMMAFHEQQMPIPMSQSQPRTTQQFHPIVFTSRNINSMDPNKRKRVARGPRSDSGCYVCRLRHLKCDERGSGCIRCEMIGIQCEYPDHKRQKPAYMVNEEAKRMKLHEIKRHTQPTV